MKSPVPWALTLTRESLAAVLTLVLLGAALFFVATDLAFSRFCRRSSPLVSLPAGRPTAALTFSGFTNRVLQPLWRRPPVSEVCATFRLTNGTTKRITYYAESIEMWTPAGWQTTTLRCTPTNWYGFSTTLQPGGVCVFHVPSLTAEKWRIRIGCVEKAEGLQGIKDRISDYRHNPRPGEDGTRRETFSGFPYQVVSPDLRPSGP
jgi:hypothetical protein